MSIRPPDKTGQFGKAWKIDISRYAAAPSCIGAWLVQRPGAHIAWDLWRVSAVPLRDIEGVPPAIKHRPDNTHEFLIFPLDPSHHPFPDPEMEELHYLYPADLEHQVAGITDEQAGWLLEAIVNTIVGTGLSPDQDFRQYWEYWIDDAIFFKSWRGREVQEQ